MIIAKRNITTTKGITGGRGIVGERGIAEVGNAKPDEKEYALVSHGRDTEYISLNIPAVYYGFEVKYKMLSDANLKIFGQQTITGTSPTNYKYANLSCGQYRIGEITGPASQAFAVVGNAAKAILTQPATATNTIKVLGNGSSWDFWLNGEYIKNVYSTWSAQNPKPTNPFLFANNGDFGDAFGDLAIAYCKIFGSSGGGSPLMFHFVPVKENSIEYSATPAPSNCMFDLVSGQYFENAGTGNFDIEEI